ncbi:MAG: mechanosensitive ion channel family protein [Chloroflexota bacterium]
MSFIELEFLGNSLVGWLVAAGVAVLSYLGLLVLRSLLTRRLGRLAAHTATAVDDFALEVLRRTRSLFLLVLAVFIGAQLLALPPRAMDFLRLATIVAALLQAALWGLALIDHLVQRRLQAEAHESGFSADKTTLGALGMLGKVILWSVVILLILENVTGIEINALIASLGVTGIAVALAVQNILGDLFASLSIALDKPFVIGDSIQVGEFSGTVEHIGLKSTRLRSFDGEQVIFANSDLLGSRIRNYQRMQRRRVVFTLGVSDKTPVEKLHRIPDMVQEIVAAQSEVTFDRAHFKQFGDFALDFECAYFVETPDLRVHMDARQAINLAIFQRFEQEGIQLAYPTQTVYLDRVNT